MSIKYNITMQDQLFINDASKQRLLHDYSEDERNLEVDALVASGDCFITLATALDDIDKTLPGATEAVQTRPELERFIRTLLYLQRHYSVQKKKPNYRQ
jgi:hypothetical protein